MNHLWRLCIIFLLLIAQPVLANEGVAKLPPIFVKENACPGEGCTFRSWRLVKRCDVYEDVTGQKVIFSLQTGDQVKALTGELHTVPFEVQSLKELTALKIKKGEKLYWLGFVGEGFSEFWKDGKVVQIEDSDTDFDRRKLIKKTESTWWIKVQLKDGRSGWTKDEKQFDSRDMDSLS